MRLWLALMLMAACAGKAGKLFVAGDQHALRERDQAARPSSPEAPPILLVALDGVSRSMLYDMLRAGELPHLAELLGGDSLTHADLDDRLLSTMPSTTMAAWVSALTGLGPAETGVTGNEY